MKTVIFLLPHLILFTFTACSEYADDDLKRITSVEKSLQYSIDLLEKENLEILQRLSTKVEGKGNRQDELALLKSAQTCYRTSDQVIQLINEISGYDPSGIPIEAKVSLSVKLESIDENIALAIEGFIEKIKALTHDSVTTKGFLDHVLLGQQSPYKVEIHELLKGKPDAFCKLALAQIAFETQRVTNKSLDYFDQQVIAPEWAQEDVLVINPDSRVIPNHSQYRADLLFIKVAWTDIKRITLNGKEVPFEKNTLQKELKFTPHLDDAEFDPKTGLAKKKFQATVTLPYFKGGDTTVTIEETYFVDKHMTPWGEY